MSSASRNLLLGSETVFLANLRRWLRQEKDAKKQGSQRRDFYVFYVNLFNLEVILRYRLFLFKLEVNVLNLDIILHNFSSVKPSSQIMFAKEGFCRLTFDEKVTRGVKYAKNTIRDRGSRATKSAFTFNCITIV